MRAQRKRMSISRGFPGQRAEYVGFDVVRHADTLTTCQSLKTCQAGDAAELRRRLSTASLASSRALRHQPKSVIVMGEYEESYDDQLDDSFASPGPSAGHTDERAPKKRRRRAALSCIACKQRKIKVGIVIRR